VRSIAPSTAPVSADPGCRTTAWAPIASPQRSEMLSDRSDFSQISESSLAQLIR
jgi:hypothetical protein